MFASSIQRILCVALVAALLLGPACAADKVSSDRGGSADGSLPNAVMRFRPSGSQRVWLVAEVQVVAKTGRIAARSSGKNADLSDFESLFENAVLFERYLGMRLVPRASKSSDVRPDYIEIRRNGTGYSVHSSSESAHSEVYLTSVKLTAGANSRFGDVASLTAIADIDYAGGRKSSARVEMKLRLSEDFRSGSNAEVLKQEPGGATPSASTSYKASKSHSRKKPDAESD